MYYILIREIHVKYFYLSKDLSCVKACNSVCRKCQYKTSEDPAITLFVDNKY